jgi:hypothetical protein
LNGPALERRQVLLGKHVDIGAELFVWSCTLARTAAEVTESTHNAAEIDRLLRLTHHFGKLARHRIEQTFHHLRLGTHERTSLAIAKDL